MNAIHRLTQYCLSLALAGACALPSRAAEEPAAAPPAGWEDCEVAEYREEAAPAGARATAGDKVERWVLRSSRVPGAVYAVKRTVRGRKEISMCAYSPNRVLATLGPGQDYASFVEAMAAKGLKVVRLLMEDLDGNPVYVVESENTETDLVDQMTMSIEETGMCGTVAPDHIYEAETVPNDPDWAAQWGLEKIGAPQAWETRTDASSVLVAVLDTGINHDHFDLNRNLWTNPGEIPGDGVDNDGNGVVDDVFGVACIGGNAGAATMDDNGHGTHCAGIIGAVGNNWRNGAGVAWSAKIMSLKFLNGEGRGAVSDAITCLRYAAEQGVRVVNCSFGSADWDDYLFAQMVKMGKAGTVFACAAGNARNGQPPRDNDVFPFYPANFQVDNLVAVAASDPEDRLANFSYYGAANVDIAAPGTDIRSTVLGTYGMDAKSGTSMATPHVAGALALLMAEYPEEDAGRITERLYAAAEPVAALAGKVRTGARLSMAGFFGIAPPTEVSATQGTVQDAVVLYWTAAKDATHYRVWRADSEDGEKTMLCDWRQGLTYGDTEAEPGVTNWYFLQAARSASGDKASVFSAGVPGFRPAPDDRHVTVSFDAAGGTVERTSALYEIGAPYGSFPAAQRDGMAFLGWHTAAEGGARVDESCVADADTTALHAHWIDGDALRVERLFARQRYPWNGLVDVTFELAGVPAGEFASVALEGNWTDDGGEGADAAPVPLATWEAGRPAGLGNGEHHGVWNADADAGAGAFGELALRASASVDVPPPPAEGTAEDNPAEGVIDLSWSAARGATSYAVSRADRDDRAAAAPAAEVEGTSWRDTGAEAGNVYHYWIQSASSGGTSEGALHLWARRGLIPVSLEIGGPGEVDAGTTVQYSATAVLNDGSSVAVADAAAWSVASGGGLVAFVGPGTLVAAGTPAGGDAVVRAVFETNGVSATAEKTVAVRTVDVRVVFDGNGGTADPAERTYTAYGAYGELAAASRTGYAFGGWFTEPDGGSRVAGMDTVPPEGLTLYAHWTANTYTVKFDTNGGTGTMEDQPMTYDTAAALRANAFARTGYTFAGWATSAGGAVAYADGESVENLASGQGATVTLYAVWTANTYTVRFNANGGSGSMADQAMTYDQTTSLRANGFARTGYTFAGWATSSGGGVAYADGAGVKNLASAQGAVVTLYAVWRANTYYVRFNANGGSGSMSDQTLTYNAAAALSANAFTKNNNAFMGWSSTSSGNVAWADRAVVTNLTSAQGAVVQMYAVWLAPPATVTASDATSTDAVTVTWTAASRAASYEVWRGTSTSSGSATRLATGLTGTTYTDSTAAVGTQYYYWVKSVNGSFSSGLGGGDAGRRMVGVPRITSASADIQGTSILSWSAVTGAVRYEIWRERYAQSPGGAVTATASRAKVADVTGTSHSVSPAASGNEFSRFYVRAVSATDAGGLSNYAEVRSYRTAGSYSLAIPSAGHAHVSAVGGGGGGAMCWYYQNNGNLQGGGGSGAAWVGTMNLAAGSYTVTVGAGGSGANVSGYAANGGTGGATALKWSSGTWVQAGGGGGGAVTGYGAAGGTGGSVAVSSGSVVSTATSLSGKAGQGLLNAYAKGGASVLGGYGAGGNATLAGGVGFFQIAFVQ